MNFGGGDIYNKLLDIIMKTATNEIYFNEYFWYLPTYMFLHAHDYLRQKLHIPLNKSPFSRKLDTRRLLFVTYR